MWVCTHRGQKKVLGPLELELLVNCELPSMATGTPTCTEEALHGLLTAEPSLTPLPQPS